MQLFPKLRVLLDAFGGVALIPIFANENNSDFEKSRVHAFPVEVFSLPFSSSEFTLLNCHTGS